MDAHRARRQAVKPPGAHLELRDGTRLYHRLEGAAGAPPLVLLNGLLSELGLWNGAMPVLRSRFRVLRLDGRGQGRSDAPEGKAYTPGQGAEDLWELLQLLGLERPWLAGLSHGAHVALELLVRHPGAFAGAVLVSAQPCVDLAMELRLRHWLHCLELGGPLFQFEAAAPELWGQGFLERRYALLRAHHEAVMGGAPRPGEDPWRGLRRQVEGALAWDARARMASIQAPVLLLCGAEDPLAPPWKALACAQRIRGSRLEVLPGIGHAFPVEDPRGFATRLLEFVDEAER